MEINHSLNRIHPLMAGAAVCVMLVSLAGIAAMTGVLPSSHASAVQMALNSSPQVSAIAPAFAPAQQGATVPAFREDLAQHKIVVHHHRVQNAQAQSLQQYSQAPVYQQTPPAHQQQPAPVVQNSPIGIGIGAVLGGLLGHQVGAGNGKTLATLAGAVGGGYIGNEVAKRNP